MKEGREIMKLGDVCKVIAGQSPRGNAYNDKGLGVEFHQGKKAFGKDVIQPSGVWTTEITKMAEAGDILMSVRAPVGPTNYTDRSVCIGRGLAAIRCSELVLPQYILYALKNIESKIVGKDGAVFNSISKDMIEDLPVPKLPLSEQRHIVSLLDAEFAKIDTLKANAERNLQNAKDLFQAALKKELEPKEGWVRKKLNDLYDVRDGTHDSPKYQATGYPLVTSKNLRNGIVDMTNVKYISQQDYDKINERSKVDVGDVLFAMIGTIGNPSLVVEEPNYAIKNMALFKVPSNQSGSLLRYVLSSNQVLDEMHNKAKGSNQPFVSLGYLRNFEITIPQTLEEQNSLVCKLDTLDGRCKTLQANYEKTIALCDDLKQALLRKAFNGEI